MSKSNGNGVVGNNSKLDAIKEIIFGQTMQEYDQRFSQIEQTLRNALKEQSGSINQQIKELASEISNLRLEVQKELHELKKQTSKDIAELKEVKADRKVLKNHLIQLIENL